jgi:N-acetylmuramoyl-L-alanine amidase
MPFLLSRRVISVLLAALLVTFSASADGVRLKTVVIDPGHGGHDAGAISLDGKLMEKNVVLDVATRLGERITKDYPDVKVIYTRSKDVFIPLDKRADIANKNHADLFISIHCNSVPKTSKAPSGSETFVMGMNKNAANMEVCKRENSVILMEDDYSTKYQGFDPNDTESYIFFNLMQNAYFEQSLIFAELCQKELHKGPIPTNRGIKQGGLLVLWRTTMPSVLVELGFITNANDRTTLASPAKREQLAGCLFNSFEQFKKQYEGGSGAEAVTETVATPEPEVEPETPAAEPAHAEPMSTTPALNETANDGSFFAVQIFALSKELESGAPQFKGEKDIHRFKFGSVFKYTAGAFKTESEAAAEAQRMAEKFPGCFVVKIDNFEIKKK